MLTRNGTFKVAAIGLAIAGAAQLLPIERHTNNIPKGTSEAVVNQCSETVIVRDGFFFKSTRTGLNAACTAQVEVEKQAACAAAKGIAAKNMSPVLLAGEGYCVPTTPGQ